MENIPDLKTFLESEEFNSLPLNARMYLLIGLQDHYRRKIERAIEELKNTTQ